MFLIPTSSFADGVSSSVFCSVAYYQGSQRITVSDSSQSTCGVAPLGFQTNPSSSFVQASAYTSYTLSLAQATTGYEGASVDATTLPNINYLSSNIPSFTNATANASIQLQYTLTSTGRVRPGIIEFNPLPINVGFDYGGYDPDQYSSVQANIGNISLFCEAAGVSSSCGFTGPVLGNSPPVSEFAFTLGQPFTFSEAITIDTGSNFVDYESTNANGTESGNAHLDVNFRLLEADATTPVVVEIVPEPSTFSLFVGALAILPMIRRHIHPRSPNMDASA